MVIWLAIYLNGTMRVSHHISNYISLSNLSLLMDLRRQHILINVCIDSIPFIFLCDYMCVQANVSLPLSSLFSDRLEGPQWKIDPLLPCNLPYIVSILICLFSLKYMDCLYVFLLLVNGFHRLSQFNILYIIGIWPTTFCDLFDFVFH